MGESLRRNARRVCLSIAAVCAAVSFVSPNALAEDEPVVGDDVAAPEVFAGDASALAVSVAFRQQYPVVPVEDLFAFIALEGKSTYTSSSRSARASIFFPGNGGIIGPGLACGTFGNQFPSEFKPIIDTCLRYNYPLSVAADDFQPDVSTTGSLALGSPKDDVSGEAVLARAQAKESGSSSDAVLNALRVNGLPPFGPLTVPVPQLALDGSVATAESVSARTKQSIEKGTLVTQATTTLSGVRLVGGLVKIGAIDAISKTTDDGQGAQTTAADLDVSGVTVAGQPAKLTNKGLVVSDPKNPTPLNRALVDQANDLVKELGIKVTVLPTEEVLERDGPAVASVGGVLVEFSREFSGLPLLPSPIAPGQQIDPNGRYTVSVHLAQTGAMSTAANFGSDDAGEFTDDFGDVDDGADFDGGGFDSGGFDDADDFAIDDGGNTGAVSDGGRGRSSTGGSGGGPSTLASSTLNNFGGRLELLYLALMFGVLGLCIAPRVALPARLPGPK